MTLKRAKLIAALIADLEKDCEFNDYVAEVHLRPHYECEYSVLLYSKSGAKTQLLDLIVFASALDKLGVNVHVYLQTNSVELH